MSALARRRRPRPTSTPRASCRRRPCCPERMFGHFEKVHQSFARAGQPPLVAIEDISFDLEQGSLVTLLGPSGCGKTTFLRIAGGLIAATGGTVQIGGRDVTEPHE